MELFYNISSKEILEIRNEIFLRCGVKILNENNFFRSPFLTSWFGKNNLGDYTYEFCKIASYSHLQMIKVHISRGDKWIKIFLNIFKLHPDVESISQLNGIDGLQYHLPPNSMTDMRLRVDNIKGIPLFNLFSKQHKIGIYFSKSSFDEASKNLEKLIAHDLNNISYFVGKWHEVYSPLLVNWDGKVVSILKN